MFLQDKLSHHQNAFMALVGVVSALLNAMPFLALAHLSGTDDSAAAQNVSALIAVSAFFTYARFRLLVSARTGLLPRASLVAGLARHSIWAVTKCVGSSSP